MHVSTPRRVLKHGNGARAPRGVTAPCLLHAEVCWPAAPPPGSVSWWRAPSPRSPSRAPSAAGRRTPSHHPFPPLMDDPNGILALPPGFRYHVVTRAGETQLVDGRAHPVEPRRHRRLPCAPQPAAPDPEPRARRRRHARRPARRGHRLRPRAPGRRRLHRDRDRQRRQQLRRVGRHLRHRRQLRGRPDTRGAPG